MKEGHPQITLDGGAGNDTITGGAGNGSIDLSAGGSDTVVFANIASNNGADTITGFKAGINYGGGDLLSFAAFQGSSGGVADAGSVTGIQAYDFGSLGAADIGRVGTHRRQRQRA